MNKILTLIFLLFCTRVSFSQNKPNTLLWEISKTGAPLKSYLFGTFHEVNPDFFDSIKIANEYLKKSKLLIVESYTQQSDSIGIKSQQNSLNIELSSWNKAMWDSLLTKSQSEKFDNYARSKYGSENMYERSPQILTFILLRNYLQGICDTINRQSYDLMDTRIIDIGLRNKLKIIGLEADQIKEMKRSAERDSALSDHNSVNMIMDLISYISSGNSNTSTSKPLKDYKMFNVDYEFDSGSDATNYLLIERTNNWMKTIPSLLATEPCFIAVGFRHLGRKNGIISQLRKLGYTVQVVKL